MAAAGVALLLVTGIVVSVIAAVDAELPGDEHARDQPSTPVEVSATTAASDPIGEDASAAVAPSSICGLPELVPDAATTPAAWRLPLAPDTIWRDVDVNLAPSAAEAGPAAVHDDGFAFCFQRSPEGALFAAANFLVQSNTPGLRAPLLDYALAAGDHREALIADADSAGVVVRLQIVGYRMLAFDDGAARVDVAQRVTVDGASNVIAAVVELVWVNGDWRIPTDGPHPVRMQALSDVGGYTRWGA